MLDRHTGAIAEQTSKELLALNDAGQLAYTKSVYPRLIPLVNELTGSLAANNNDTHAAFWLMYLQSYNLLSLQIRKSLDGEESDLSIRASDIHIDGITEFLFEVEEATGRTKKPTFFQDQEARDLLDTVVTIYADKELDIEEWAGNIIEIPSRMERIAKRIDSNALQNPRSIEPVYDDLSWEKRPEDFPILTWALLRTYRRPPRTILHDNY